jgi:peptide/nickel transport system ATP-binding protein/oligopeptide transport system ATP-binding protein
MAGPNPQTTVVPDPDLVLEVEGLKKHFPIRKGVFSRTVGRVLAVDGVGFTVRRGETLGLVGESGCGKTTVGKCVLRLLEPTEGRIHLRGRDITHVTGDELLTVRRDMQMIFQDPYSSLNSRLSAAQIVSEPLENYRLARGREAREKVRELFAKVGLRREHMAKHPHEFSGGQRQRIGIARALALNPSLVVADEPVSALDVSVQAQVINLLMDLQKEFHLAYLFIAHDLAVVNHISHRIAVMYLGQIVEMAEKKDLFRRPLHPYTEALLVAVPLPDPRRRREQDLVEGDVPSPVNPPPGCRFHTRCPYVMEVCRERQPAFLEIEPGHFAACHLRTPD